MEKEEDAILNDDEIKLSEEHLEKFRALINTDEQYESSSGESFVSDADSEEDEEVEKEYIKTELGETDKTSGITVILFLPFNYRWTFIQHLIIIIQCSIILASMGLSAFTDTEVIYQLWIITVLDVIYCIDFFLSLIYKNWTSLNTTQIHKPKPVWVFALEILSLIPLDQLYKSFTPKINWRLFSFLSLNRLLRLNFMYLYVAKNRKAMNNRHALVRLFEYGAIITILAHTAIPLMLWYSKCNVHNAEACNNTWIEYFTKTENWPGGATHIELSSITDLYWLTIYVIMAKLSTNGLGGEMEWKSMRDYAVLSLLTIFSIFMYAVVILVTTIQIVVLNNKAIEMFKLNESVILKYLNEQNVDKEIINRVRENYAVCWMKFRGIRGFPKLSFLPLVGLRSISIDLYWAAFQHSHMFRELDVAFLRTLSTFCKPYFFLPGDVIYQKNQMKAEMIYVVKGVLQIVSEEDDETPIISLSAGTCIGSSSLNLSMKSTTILKCATFCELHVLNRKSYCATLKRYPYHQKALITYTMNRLKQAKHLHSISNFLQSERRAANYYDETRMGWFKNTLADLMKRTHQKNTKEEATEKMHFESDDSIYQNVQHTAAYLDLYVLADKLEWECEIACLSERWPWILHPDSSFSRIWQKFILLIILIVAFIVPQNAVYTQSTDVQIAVSIVSSVFLLDIYIQLSTAVRTQDKLIVEMKKILYLKFMSLPFIVDLIGSLPIEYSVHIIYKTIDKYEFLCFLQFNRLILLYKVHLYFGTLENSLHTRGNIIRIIKYFLYSLILIYMYTCILFAETCTTFNQCYQFGWLRSWIVLTTNKTDFRVPLYFSTMIMTGLSLRDIQPTCITDIYTVTIGFILSILLFIYLQSSCCAFALLVRKHWYTFYEATKRVEHFMVSREIDKKIQKRVISCMMMEWTHNKAMAFFRGNILSGMPEHLKDDIQINMCANALRHVKLFEGVPVNFINTLATWITIHLVPAKEIVIYAGTVNQEMYIILNGYCEVLSNEDNSVLRTLGPNSHFSGVEICLDIPVQNTVRTVTTCNILSLTNHQFKRVLAEFPDIASEFRILIKSMQEIKNQFNEINEVTYQEISDDGGERHKQSSFYYFGFFIKNKAEKWKDYVTPFKKNPLLHVFMIFLMRITFYPDGTLLKIWEFFRLIVAFLSCLLAPSLLIFFSAGYEFFWIVKYTLDAICYLDIYIRLHVCYYNEKGLLIKHPLMTAAHYLKNGFLLDFLACAPIEVFFVTSDVQQNNIRGLILYNRLLQLLRIISGIIYANESVKTPWFYRFCKYVPLLLITINVVGTLLVKYSCDFHEKLPRSENFTAGVKCPGINWVTRSNYAKTQRPLSPMKVYLLGIYFATSLLFRQGLPGITAQNLEECLIIAIFSYLGYFFIILFMGLLAASRITKKTDLVSYQEEMKSLNEFMERRQIPFDIRKDAIDYFEIFWMNKRGTTAHGTLDSFHSSLKFDALYDMYSNSINLHCVLTGANRSFYHAILELAVPEFYIKKVNICQVNDVTDKFYIMHKGRVEVKGANGNRLIVLNPGAIFGNIRYTKQSRMTVTFQPLGQVEVLVLSSEHFYRVLACYPALKKRFEHITKLHADYIPAISFHQMEDLQSIHYTDAPTSGSVVASGAFQINIIQPDSFYYRLWEGWTLIIGGYITFGLVIYQLCAQDGMPRLFTIGYIFDLCYAVRPYLKLKLSYENEVGEMVRRPALIRRRYFHSKLGFVLDIITIPPIELIALFLPHKLFYYTLFRLNRLPRIFMVYEFFEVRKNKINVHVFWMRFTFVLLWNSLMLHVLICAQIMRLCVVKDFCSKTFQVHYSKSFLHLYMMIAYDTLGMSSTTTFANILPHDSSLLIYFCIASFICYFNAAVFIGEVYSIMEMITYNLMDYITTINEFKATMKRNKMSTYVVVRMWYYVCILWDNQRGRQYPKMLIKAPYHLRERVNACIYRKLLKQCYIFSSCEEDLIRQIVGKMREFTFYPGNFITYEGEMDDSMYFILEGKIQIMLDGRYSLTFIRTLHEGDIFGLAQGLQPEIPHTFTYRAKTKVVIIVLTKSKWEYLLDFFPASKQYLLEQSNNLLKEVSEDSASY